MNGFNLSENDMTFILTTMGEFIKKKNINNQFTLLVFNPYDVPKEILHGTSDSEENSILACKKAIGSLDKYTPKSKREIPLNIIKLDN